MVILSWMDTRLTEFLPAALGIKNGDIKMIKMAGGMVTTPTDSVMRSLIVAIYAFDIKNVIVIIHDDCGMGDADNSYLLDKMINRGISEELVHILDS